MFKIKKIVNFLLIATLVTIFSITILKQAHASTLIAPLAPAIASKTSTSVTLTPNFNDGNDSNVTYYLQIFNAQNVLVGRVASDLTTFLPSNVYTGIALTTAAQWGNAITISGLSSNTVYRFRFGSHDPGTGAELVGPMSASVTTSQVIAPLAPAIASKTSTSVTLTPNFNDGNDSNVTYYLQIFNAQNVLVGRVASDLTTFLPSNVYTGIALTTAAQWGNSITISGLSSNTVYHFRFGSHDPGTGAELVGPMSASVTTSQLIAPLTPVIASKTSTTVTLTPNFNDGNDSNVTYYLQIFNAQNVLVGRVASDLTTFLPSNVYTGIALTTAAQWGNAITISGLSPNTVYRFRFGSHDPGTGVELVGPMSVSVTTLGTPVVPTVTSLVATVNSPTQITLYWQGTSEQYDAATDPTFNYSSGWVVDNYYIFANLQCGTTYTFQVKGKNIEGTTSATSSVAAQTQMCSVPNGNQTTTPGNNNDIPGNISEKNYALPVSCPASLTAGSMIKVSGHAPIYLLNSKLQVLYFPTGDEFKSWNLTDAYGGYVTISETCIDSLHVPSAPPGGVSFRPGSRLLKKASSSQLYVVEPNNTLATINATAAKALYPGVIALTVADTVWSNYVNRGPAITNATPHPGMVVSSGSNNWYVDTSNVLRPINADTLLVNRLRNSFIRAVTPDVIANLTIGVQINTSTDELSNRAGVGL